MAKISEIAIEQSIGEVRAACRTPIDQQALETLVEWMRPEFERLLVDRVEGARRWAEAGQEVRQYSRFIGALADFFGNHADVRVIGVDELSHAVSMVRARFTVDVTDTSPAAEFYRALPVDTGPAEEFFRAIPPLPEPAKA